MDGVNFAAEYLQPHNMPFDRETMKEKAAALAAKGVYVGTVSWKYEGWFGQLYTLARYEHRGKLAKTRFERDCLSEYAEVFKTVSVDAAYQVAAGHRPEPPCAGTRRDWRKSAILPRRRWTCSRCWLAVILTCTPQFEHRITKLDYNFGAGAQANTMVAKPIWIPPLRILHSGNPTRQGTNCQRQTIKADPSLSTQISRAPAANLPDSGSLA